MILLIYSVLQIPSTLSFKWFHDEGNTYDNNNPFTYNLPKYDAKIEDAPHHVLVYYARLYCSGSLVSSRAVVTCASCFFKRASETTYVKAGSRHYMDGKSQRIRVIEVKTHEFYRRLSPVDNDIALLFLEKNMRLSSQIKKIPLAEPEVSLRIGHAIRVSGYGADNVIPRLRNQLLQTTLVVVENSVCTSAFGNLMSFSTYCGKLYLPENRLSDNGGGATLMDLLVGVLVVGGATDIPNAAILTNVSYFHRWIVLNTHRFHEKYCNKTIGFEEIGSYEDYGMALLSKKNKVGRIIKNMKEIDATY